MVATTPDGLKRHGTAASAKEHCGTSLVNAGQGAPLLGRSARRLTPDARFEHLGGVAGLGGAGVLRRRVAQLLLFEVEWLMQNKTPALPWVISTRNTVIVQT